MPKIVGSVVLPGKPKPKWYKKGGACWKKPYDTPQAAYKGMVQATKRENGHKCNIYKCESCGKFHLTSCMGESK